MSMYNIGNDHKQPLYLYDQRSFCDGIFTRFNTVYFEAHDNKKINHLTHGWVTSLVYEDYDYAYAYEFLKEKYYPLYASCSSVQKGNIRGRNYDWTYDYQPTFIIRTPADHGRHATIGIAAGQGDITRFIANSKTPSEYYKILPFRIVDGINDAGLLVNVNVCQIYNDAGELDITNITDKEEPAIPALMFTRYILDYCSTIDDVISVVNKRNFFMANSEALVEEFHYMITDKTGKTVVIEFKDNEPVVTESNFMTNYKLCSDTGADYGAGHERVDIINSQYDDISDAESMLDVMKSVWYTNAYKSFIEDRDIKWLSECNGKTLLPSGEIADLHQGLPEEDYTDIVDCMIHLYNNRSRDTGYTWQTVHTSVYDVNNKKLILVVQENDNYKIELSFDDIYKQSSEPIPPKPELPPFTLRFKASRAVTTDDFSLPVTLTLVDDASHTYDLTYENENWTSMFNADEIGDSSWLIEVVDANLDGVTLLERAFYYAEYLERVNMSDISSVTDMSNMFNSCSSLTSVSLFDTSNVTAMSYMFAFCSSLTSVSLFDTSNVTDMSNMFTYCSSLTSVPEFNTSSVTDMSNMFAYYCSSLTSVPEFDTSNVTDMSNMFAYCSSLTSVPAFDTRNVTDMSNMFAYCSSLTSVPEFNTSSVNSMNAMFDGCTALTDVPLFDTSNVTNMSYMFAFCSSLTSVPAFDTRNVTYMQDMFYRCTALTDVPLFNTSSVNMMNSMFEECTALTDVPLFNTSSVIDMSNMFEECTALTDVPLFNTSSVINMSNMFDGCTSVESGALALYQQASTQANPPRVHNSTFTNCGADTASGVAELHQIPKDWGGLKE